MNDATINTDMKHWRLTVDNGTDGQDIVVATLDVVGGTTNVLSYEVMHELEQLLSGLLARPLAGLVICSGKPAGFIAGADVREFEHITDAQSAAEAARAGQRVLNRLAHLPFPSVAVINGFCLGGGLELALACRYRVACDDPNTQLGLPEVRLGIHPGFAGTVRLPRLIGHLPALDLMLSGRSVGASAARRLGLVDEVVPERHLLHAAQALLRERPVPHTPKWYQRWPGWTPLRPIIVRLLEKRVAAKANPDHYPAPYRILELWRRNASQEQEAESLGELIISRTSRNLVHVFLLGENLKRQARVQPHNIRHVHVIGAGVMGADIAMWIASKDFSVSLQDQTPEILARAMTRAHRFFTRKLKDPRRIQQAMDRLMPDRAGVGLRHADLVIEAIVERVEPKQELFRTVEQTVSPQTLLATNTSSIPLETVAKTLSDPSRLVGLHFFNPATKMPLVEVVRGTETSKNTLGRAHAFTAAIDRLPLEVKSSPGFLVNRALMPYLLEAVSLLEEGVSPEDIDHAAREFGMPVGPIELADTVGLDICLAVGETLAGPFKVAVPASLKNMVEQGRLGKKNRRGFFTYDAHGRRKTARALLWPRKNKTRLRPISPITERLILRLLNEVMACLREGVVTNKAAIDAGLVYGTGFAPYLGGPMRYAESLGVTGISHSLHRLSQEYGNRFAPDSGWSQPEVSSE